MVFQDGHAYVDVKGQFRVPTVFDNLIAKGDMPITIAVFVDPGSKRPLPRETRLATRADQPQLRVRHLIERLRHVLNGRVAADCDRQAQRDEEP